MMLSMCPFSSLFDSCKLLIKILIVVSSLTESAPVEFLRNIPCNELIDSLSIDWICLEISNAESCKWL